MTLDKAHLDQARKVADAILYEGYLLYPYRQSARKNQERFQFGVLMPPAYRDVDDSESSACQTECLAECRDDDTVEIVVRFLQLQRRTVHAVDQDGTDAGEVDVLRVDPAEFTPWDEAREAEQRLSLPVSRLLGAGTERTFHLGRGEATEDITDSRGHLAGRFVRRWGPVDGAIRVRAQRVAGPYGALKLHVRVENRTLPGTPPRGRGDGLRHALIAVHALIGIPGGTFLSMTDPPEWAAAEVAACTNTGTWPVLAGPAECRNLMLSSPVILYDHPEIAPESAGDLFDATEIDEILTLRTLALTDAEKQEARSTDPRAADLIDRLDDLPPEMLERMHGAIRYLHPSRGTSPSPGQDPAHPGPAAGSAGPGPRGMPAAGSPIPAAGPGMSSVPGTSPGDAGPFAPSVPWWDPGADSSVSPETDHVMINGVRVARGSVVRMRPGSRRADAQDLFLVGRDATVEAVLHDVDGQVHVAVTPVSDPAADLQRSHGRFLYFAPDELEPAETSPAAGGDAPGGHDDRMPGQKEETT